MTFTEPQVDAPRPVAVPAPASRATGADRGVGAGAAPSHNTRSIKGPAHAWYPYSACGRGCIDDDLRARGAGPLTVARRLVGLVRIPGLVAEAAAAVSRPQRERSAAGPRIARRFLAYFGVEVVVDAQPRALEALRGAGVLIAVNHHTWWDVPVLASVAPVRFIARADLRSAPVIGPMIERMGTVFIDRSRLRGLPEVVRTSAELLRDGHNLVAFPEATTWCGTAHGRFRPALFQAAIDSGAVVVPVEIEYRDARGRRTAAAAFVGRDTVGSSLWSMISGRCASVHVRLYPPLQPGVNAPGRRHDLAAVTHHVIFGDSGERTHHHPAQESR